MLFGGYKNIDFSIPNIEVDSKIVDEISVCMQLDCGNRDINWVDIDFDGECEIVCDAYWGGETATLMFYNVYEYDSIKKVAHQIGVVIDGGHPWYYYENDAGERYIRMVVPENGAKSPRFDVAVYESPLDVKTDDWFHYNEFKLVSEETVIYKKEGFKLKPLIQKLEEEMPTKNLKGIIHNFEWELVDEAKDYPQPVPVEQFLQNIKDDANEIIGLAMDIDYDGEVEFLIKNPDESDSEDEIWNIYAIIEQGVVEYGGRRAWSEYHETSTYRYDMIELKPQWSSKQENFEDLFYQSLELPRKIGIAYNSDKKFSEYYCSVQVDVDKIHVGSKLEELWSVYGIEMEYGKVLQYGNIQYTVENGIVVDISVKN